MFISTGQDLLGYNMFAYCGNNPVKNKDSEGFFAESYYGEILDIDDPYDENGFYYAYMPNPIDAGYRYHIDLSIATRSSFTSGGLYGTGYATYGNYSSLTSTTQTASTTATGKGTRNSKVKAAILRGIAMHKQMDYGPGVLKEQTIAPGCRVDGIDLEHHIIYELKPNNPRAIARGRKQLKRYIAAAETSPKLGGSCSGVLIVYD